MPEGSRRHKESRIASETVPILEHYRLDGKPCVGSERIVIRDPRGDFTGITCLTCQNTGVISTISPQKIRRK